VGGAHAAGKRRLAAGLREDRRDFRLGERPQLEPGDVGAWCQAGHDVAEQGRPAGLGVAVGRQHEQPHGGVGAQHVAQEHQRQIVGPVQIVEHEEHRRRRPGGLQQRGGGLQRAQLLDLGLGGRGLGDARDARGELGQQRDQVARART
jgi:hypothetical protein